MALNNNEREDLIDEFNLEHDKTGRFMQNSIRDGKITTDGRYIDDLMPPMSLFGETGKLRTQKKQQIIDSLKEFFDKYKDIATPNF